MSSAPGIAVPGSSVPTSSLVTPGGAQGIQGIQGPVGPAPYTVTTADFTMPPAGSSVSVTVQDASWVIVGEMLAVQTAGGSPTTAASMRCTAKTGNQLTLLYQPPTTLPLASTMGPGLLTQVTGNPTDYVGGDNACHDTGGVITSVRLRSFNSVGNPNFEVDQRNVGNSVNPAAGAFCLDRWSHNKLVGGAANILTQQMVGSVLIPGTSFPISAKFLRITNQAVVSSPAAGDYSQILTQIEGAVFRELSTDVHSCSVLVRCSVSGLKFGVSLRDPPTTGKSLTKLCQHSATANTWTIITLPNLPVWPSGNFVITPGVAGYLLGITLMSGTTYTSPANDTWQSGNFLAATGQDNFLATNGATFDVAFVQHEPGPQCTQLQDKPFAGANGNLEDCLRYYCKSYSYATKAGTSGTSSYGVWTAIKGITGSALARGHVPYPKRMAKAPTVTVFDPTNANAAGSVYWENATTNGVTTVSSIAADEAAITQMVPAGSATGPVLLLGAYTADTGW